MKTTRMEHYDDGNVHVVPDDDVIEHLDNGACPCQPKFIERDKDGPYKCAVIVHNRLKDLPQ